MPAHLHQKVLYAGFTYFLFSIFCCKSIDLKAFHAFGLAFCWLPFPWSSYFKRSIWAENPKFRMRPIGFNTCNFCCIYLLNNRNFECRHTSIKRCYTQGLHISFQYSVAKVLIWKLSMLLVLLFAGCLFLEVPTFSSQFERKIQNLEWGPLHLTLATLAVFSC